METEFGILLTDLWRDLQEPAVLWQAIPLVLALLIAKSVEYLLTARKTPASQVWRLGQRGAKRLAFPVVALLLVLAVRWGLRHWHHVNLLNVVVPLLLSLAVIRAVFFILRQSFIGALWLANFERVFATLAWAVVALHITGLLPTVIESLRGVAFMVGKQELNLWMVFEGIGTVAFSLLVALWIGSALESWFMGAEGLDPNLRVVLSRVGKAVLALIAVLVALPMVGIDLTTLSVFGGALGVGLGFGLQKVAANYISGFIILLDRSIRIGDVVTVGKDRGQVSTITTRYTVLKGLTGVDAIVPNETLVSGVVLNESYTNSNVRIALPIQVAYGTDLDQALALLIQAARDQPRVLKDPEPVAHLRGFGDFGVNLELGCWISDPQESVLSLQSAIYLQIWRSFKAANIEIPFPQQDIRLIKPE